ncbi:MAG TPA: hypothetical protein VLA16_00230 [Ideonella sp.]|nr:hypothetical protein [Ideonella sp.]
MPRAPRDMSQLLDQIVFLEEIDAQHVGMHAGRYLAAARSVRRIVERQLGRLSMRDFVTETLPALQTTAENIFFDGHGHFADLDGSGAAMRARAGANDLIARLQRGVTRS